MNRRPARTLAALAVALLGVAGAPALVGSAAADEPDLGVVTWDDPLAGVGDPTAPADTGPACASQGLPLDEDGDPTTLPVSSRVCFDSLAEALAFASGEPVPVSILAGADRADVARVVTDLNVGAGTAAPTAGVPARAGATTAAAQSMILGLTWRDKSYKGQTEVFWGKGGNGCFTGSTYGFSNLSSVLQNNVISSADSFAGCWSTFYDAYSYSGSKRNCTPACSTMGTLDNKASSIVYRPRGTLG
ncbi:hypothetical protein IF650_08325 [Cellulosimicrobium terreum]|nr:hypothetical protein [Cellulosimicrobium terreum]